MRGFVAGVVLGLAVGYAAGVRPPPPVLEQPTFNVRMVDLTIHGMKDRNTTNRRQKFVCKEAP